tara:strand:- start:432 stop:908 length:477 start_codon:yes stop_codon:yes gene_type:complete
MKKLLALLLLSPFVAGEDMILKCEGEKYKDKTGLGGYIGENYFKFKDGLVSFIHEGERLNNIFYEEDNDIINFFYEYYGTLSEASDGMPEGQELIRRINYEIDRVSGKLKEENYQVYLSSDFSFDAWSINGPYYNSNPEDFTKIVTFYYKCMKSDKAF